jgi:hypothetical protein
VNSEQLPLYSAATTGEASRAKYTQQPSFHRQPNFNDSPTVVAAESLGDITSNFVDGTLADTNVATRNHSLRLIVLRDLTARVDEHLTQLDSELLPLGESVLVRGLRFSVGNSPIGSGDFPLAQTAEPTWVTQRWKSIALHELRREQLGNQSDHLGFADTNLHCQTAGATTHA